ncbi:fibronectin type III domain-containing protein-like [Stylophora pistillata]|uniref:fibronectin type III domain-containing protein-like n=1 Tax=Stylophora pistillata TaxID=50429 RepID=UPI000C03C57A|nr:fibronectin type III domain-containing protein-like [Stylophora pistillata]
MDVKKEKHESTEYTCEAENSVNSGNPLSHKINLKVEVAPRWHNKAPDSKLEVDIQGNGSLLCDVYADPVPSFKWYKDGKRILSSNQHVAIDDDKFWIQNARMQEDGFYQCVAENKHGMLVSSTWIYIRFKEPTFSKPLGPFYLFKNSQGVLKCESEAAPPPTFEWFRGVTQITTGGRYTVQADGVLWINDVTEGDKGEYRCKATNFLATAEDVGTATVYERTRITVKPENKLVPQRVNIDLRCRAKADTRLELKYYWRRDDAAIEYNSKIEWLERENVLKIYDIRVDDTGNYTCVAYTPEPKWSEDQASAEVNIEGVPFPPTSVKINKKTCINRTTVLEWTTVPSNDAPILHFLIEQESNHEPDVFYLLFNVTNPNAKSVVLNLTGWSTLRFRIRAVNSFGTSRHSLPTGARICTTSKSAPEKFPENLRGAPKRAGELDITWTKMPKVYWNGPGFYYLLEYKKVLEPVNEDSPGQWQNTRIHAEVSSFKIYNPGYYELWEFRICTGNNLGQGPFSGIERSRFGQDPSQVKPTDTKTSVMIVIAVGCGVVFGIFLIFFVVFCKRRQLKNKQQETKPAVLFRHSVVEICDEIPVERPIGRESTPTEQYSQLTYRRPVNNSGKSDDGTMRNTSEDSYGYCHVYQSVDKNTSVTAAPDYQNIPTAVIEPDYQNVQTQEEGTSSTSVHSSGSQTESGYEPLKGSDRQNVYEPLNGRGN